MPRPPKEPKKPKTQDLRNSNRQRPRGLTVSSVIAALRASAGIRAVAAQKLKVDRSTVTRFIQKNPEILVYEEEIVDELIDVSEAQLINMIKKGEFPAVKFYLERKGGRAGYTRTLEHKGEIGITGQLTAPRRALDPEEWAKLNSEPA